MEANDKKTRTCTTAHLHLTFLAQHGATPGEIFRETERRMRSERRSRHAPSSVSTPPSWLCMIR
eukprot:9192380-Pyramimonas_sp.AAC.1